MLLHYSVRIQQSAIMRQVPKKPCQTVSMYGQLPELQQYCSGLTGTTKRLVSFRFSCTLHDVLLSNLLCVSGCFEK